MDIFDVMSRPADEVEEEVVDYSPKTQYSPFDFVNSINFNKKDLLETAENPEHEEKKYSSWIVNKSLSYFPDTVAYADLMNRHYHIDNKLKYSFLLNIIAPKKRYSKWSKPEKVENIDMIMTLYGYSQRKAEIALSLLSPVQIEQLKKEQEQGGVKNGKNKR